MYTEYNMTGLILLYRLAKYPPTSPESCCWAADFGTWNQKGNVLNENALTADLTNRAPLC